MLTYQHYRSDLFEETSFSSKGSVSGGGEYGFFTSWSFRKNIGGAHVVEAVNSATAYIEETSLSGGQPVTYDSYSSTDSSSYKTNYPTSILPQSQTTFEYTVGTTTHREENPPVSGMPAVTSGETSTILTSTVEAYTTGIGSRVYAMPDTTTLALNTTWFSSGTIVLSGSTTQVQTLIGFRTLTELSATTLLPMAVPSRFCEVRYFVGRGQLPPLRGVGVGFAITNVTNSSVQWATSTMGQITDGSDRFGTSSTSGESSTAYTPGGVGASPRTDRSYSSRTFLKIIAVSHTLLSAQVSASRKKYSGSVFYKTDTALEPMTWNGSSQMLDPSVQGGFVALIPIASNVFMPNIFTQSKDFSEGYSINSSSARLVWSFSSNSWKFLATLSSVPTGTSNTVSSSTTTEISFKSNANAVSATAPAAAFVGASTAVLGPLIPFVSSLRAITVTWADSLAATRPHAVYQATGATSAPASSFITRSASLEESAETFLNNTNLPFYMAFPGALLSTATTEDMQGNITFWGNEKWNEAGREDPISVSQ